MTPDDYEMLQQLERARQQLEIVFSSFAYHQDKARSYACEQIAHNINRQLTDIHRIILVRSHK